MLETQPTHTMPDVLFSRNASFRPIVGDPILPFTKYTSQQCDLVQPAHQSRALLSILMVRVAASKMPQLGVRKTMTLERVVVFATARWTPSTRIHNVLTFTGGLCCV